MKIKQFFQRFFSAKKENKESRAEISSGNSEKMEKMMAMLSRTQEVELSCDEVFALLDQFAELATQGEDVAQLMPLVQQHLDICGDCREEYKVLENILHGTA